MARLKEPQGSFGSRSASTSTALGITSSSFLLRGEENISVVSSSWWRWTKTTRSTRSIATELGKSVSRSCSVEADHQALFCAGGACCTKSAFPRHHSQKTVSAQPSSWR